MHHHRYHNSVILLTSSASGGTRVAATPAKPPNITYVYPTHTIISAITTELSVFGSVLEAHRQQSTSFFPVGNFAQGGVLNNFSCGLSVRQVWRWDQQ